MCWYYKCRHHQAGHEDIVKTVGVATATFCENAQRLRLTREGANHYGTLSGRSGLSGAIPGLHVREPQKDFCSDKLIK